MKALRAAAAAFAIGLGAGASAFVQSTADSTGVPLSWPTNVVPFSVNPSHPYTAPSCEPGAAGDPGLDAVRAAFAAWEQPCSGLELVDAGTVAEIRTGRRGTAESLVVFRQGWCSVHGEAKSHACMSDPDVDCGGLFNCFEDHGDADRNVVALTSVLYFPDTGRIVDADIEVNGWDGLAAGTKFTDSAAAHGWYFTCNGRTETPCTLYGEDGCHFIDLQNVLTHEVGHFIGLRHVCNGGGGSGADRDLPLCDASHDAITMNPNTEPGDVGMRTLHADDVAGVCAIYPAGRTSSSATSPSSSSSGGCGSGGAAGGALAAALSLAALARSRRRR